MKNQYILIVCIVALAQHTYASWSEEDRRIEAEQVSLWKMKLEEVKQKPTTERPSELWIGLRNMGYRRSYEGHSSAVDSIYESLQTEFLSTPGHAQYLADEIRKMQEKVKDVPPNTGSRIDYDRMRYSHYETLRHLPGPETVKVLGEFLDDRKDFAKIPDYQPGDFDSSGGSSPNCSLAVRALNQLGLRNSPPFLNATDPEEDDNVWRHWWEEIKSGKKTFSFKGQNVEYRFKSDGTWNTIALANPPDDGSKAPTAHQKKPEREEIRPPRTMETKKNQTSGNLWAWVIGIVTALLAGLVWLRGKKSSHG